MSASLVQATSAVGNTGTSPTTASFPSASAIGNLIVVATVLSGTVAPVAGALTDTQGNAYTQIGSTGIYWALAKGVSQSVLSGSPPNVPIPATPNTVSLAWSGGSSPSVFVAAVEYSGPWLPTLLPDSSASQAATGTAVAYSVLRGNAALLNQPDLVVTVNFETGAGVNWTGLSGTDRFGATGVKFEYNDFIQLSGAAAITATLSSSNPFTSNSASFFTITEPALVGTYAVDDLLSILNDELHGKKNAFPDTQKIRHLNKATDELWKIMKVVHGGYFLTNNAPGLVLDTVNTDFLLPSDFSEIRLIEVTNPVDYVGIDVIQMPMTSALFKNERQSFRAFQTVATADSVLAIPGQLNYDIYGPDAMNQMHLLFSRPAPVPITLLLWYVRMAGHFSVPKNPIERLQSVMSPYIWNLCTFAAKSLLKSEGTDQGEFAKWEEQWAKEIDRAMPAAHERATADDQTVEGFVEL